MTQELGASGPHNTAQVYQGKLTHIYKKGTN